MEVTLNKALLKRSFHFKTVMRAKQKPTHHHQKSKLTQPQKHPPCSLFHLLSSSGFHMGQEGKACDCSRTPGVVCPTVHQVVLLIVQDSGNPLTYPHLFFIFLSVVGWSWITMCYSIISPGTQPAKQSLLCPLQGLAGSVGGREMFGICYSKMLKAVASWREKTGLRNGQVVLCPCFLWNAVAACPNLLRALTLTEELPFKNSCSFKMLLCVKVKGAFKLWSTDCVSTETAAWDTFCWLEKRFLPTANIFSITLFQCNVKLRGRVDVYLSLKYICWHFRGKNWGFSNPGCSSLQ